MIEKIVMDNGYEWDERDSIKFWSVYKMSVHLTDGTTEMDTILECVE